MNFLVYLAGPHVPTSDGLHIARIKECHEVDSSNAPGCLSPQKLPQENSSNPDWDAYMDVVLHI